MTIQAYLAQVDEVIAKGKYKADGESLMAYPRAKWFGKAKLGIFIHWGVYSVPEFFNEWYPREMYYRGCPTYWHHLETYGKNFNYKDFIPMFTADKFNADEWLSLFRESGAKFIMPVGEHHDGFKMYESELNRWNSVNMGPKRDFLAELRSASEKNDMIFCTSSHRAEHYWFMNGGRTLPYDTDVKNPEYADFYGPAVNAYKTNNLSMMLKTEKKITPDKAWLEDWLASSCELIDRARPSALFFDWWVCHAEGFHPYMEKFLAYYCSRSVEWGKDVLIFYKSDRFPYECVVLDQERGQLPDIYHKPWQCETATARNAWSYTTVNKYKPSHEIIGNFIDVISKNGTFCINVGPRADGSICAEDTAILQDIGSFTKTNAEAIWGTRPYKIFGEGKERAGGMFVENYAYEAGEFRFTQSDDALYVFALVPAEDGVYCIKSLAEGKGKLEKPIQKAELLGGDAAVGFELNAEGLQLKAADGQTGNLPVCFKLTF